MGESNKGNGLFSKFLSVLSGKPASTQDPQSKEAGAFAPSQKEPVDLAFVKRFTDSGGKFLYCENTEEIYENLEAITKEAGIREVFCRDHNLQSILSRGGMNFSDKEYKSADAFCSECEYLISFNGGIMISENQTLGVKLEQLPEVFITIAYTSQIVENLRNGLTGIRQKYEKLPANITTIKGPKGTEGIDQMNSPSICQKDIYLILLEDQI